MGAREILLLAAEDAFEFERWREAGPVTAEIDPETSAAEIVEYEALGIPLPRELDVLRRELEFAPAVREAIRSSTTVLRRNGRAEASALVGLGPQGLMPWGAGGLDPRLMMLMDPRLARDPRLALDPRARASEPRAKGRAARAAVVDEPLADEPFERAPIPMRAGPVVVPELVDEPLDEDDEDDADDDDEFEPPPPRQRRASASPSAARGHGKPERARTRAREVEDEDDSLIAIRPAPSRDRTNTIILAVVSSVAVIALLWIAFGDKKNDNEVAQTTPTQPLPAEPVQQQPQPQPLPQPPPTELVAEPLPTPAPPPHHVGSRGSGISGSRGSTSPTAVASKPAGGGVNPFANYDANVAAGGQPQPKPAAGGTTPAPAPAPTEAAPTPAPAPAEAAPTPTPAPAEPAPAPLPEPELTKSKMTPAIREAITKKVGDLQRCYNDALVGKPDLAGEVKFVISLDQDGVVKKVDIGKDAIGYGVAACASKKIRSWTLPSAGIPIIFDLPFDFQQPKG